MKDGRQYLPPGHSPTKNQGVMDENGNPVLMSLRDHDIFVLKQIGKDESGIKSNGFETAFIYALDGTKERVSQGKGTAVEFSEKHIEKMRNGVLTHNHPLSGASLSQDDLELFTYAGMREMRAVTPFGSWTFKQGRNETWDKFTDSQKLSVVQQVSAMAENRVRTKMQGLVNNGLISPDDASFIGEHIRNKTIVSLNLTDKDKKIYRIPIEYRHSHNALESDRIKKLEDIYYKN
jgi:hypothetical protein